MLALWVTFRMGWGGEGAALGDDLAEVERVEAAQARDAGGVVR